MSVMDRRENKGRKNGWERRAAVFWIVAAGLALAGCGRRSAPKAPEGSTYGVDYPTRQSLRLPPEEPLHGPPKDDDEDETPSPGGRPQPPSVRY
ncbi:MAG: hypothetical protein A3G73_03790 [Rhodospirillales bacterium RIFCSPLOWO2_12_FULL_67_15]|nr:MAG: hypothetical protein A3G73_03790 [Rhodospirillales bacterium RIFCSPLOWO2_12_FULL_67_15]